MSDDNKQPVTPPTVEPSVPVNQLRAIAHRIDREAGTEGGRQRLPASLFITPDMLEE